MRVGFLAIAGNYYITSGDQWQTVRAGDGARYLWVEPTADLSVEKTAGGDYTRICGGSTGWDTLFEYTGKEFTIPNHIWKPQSDADNNITFRETK